MTIIKRRRVWIVVRNRLRRLLESSADSWAQTKFIGGLILLAGVISLVLTTDLHPAGGGVVTSNGPAGRTDPAGHPDRGDCGARSIDRPIGAGIASMR
jgi:hypothetical protein